MAFAKKRFGQNFLHDHNIIQKIAQVIGCSSNDHIVEIGPGKAALTKTLLKAKRLDIIEIDNDLIFDLESLANQHPNIQLHHADALRFDYGQLISNESSLRIVGNLPYNISTPLIFHLLNYRKDIQDMHFMLQKEVVERICAEPGSKTYGRLSVMTQYYCKVGNLFTVPPTAFVPQPKIDSAIIRFTPYKHIEHPANNIEQLQTVVTHAFSKRRKTLSNSLKGLISTEQLLALEIDPQQRPEQLSVQDYVSIANYIEH